MLDSQVYFDIADDTNFVQLRQPDQNILDQGTTLRLEFTDSVETIRQKIRSHLQAPAEANINLIEVQPLQNTFCALKNPLSLLEGDKLAKDCGFQNQSTWMVLIDQPELEARLLPCAGVTSVPITVKLSAFGTDQEVNVYTNSTVQELIAKFASLSGKTSESLKVKVIDETQTRRIDTQVYEKSTLTLPVQNRILNSLQDVKLTNNAVVMLEEKSAEELAGDGEVKDVELIDDTDNIRTVLANVGGFD